MPSEVEFDVGSVSGSASPAASNRSAFAGGQEWEDLIDHIICEIISLHPYEMVQDEIKHNLDSGKNRLVLSLCMM